MSSSVFGSRLSSCLGDRWSSSSRPLRTARYNGLYHVGYTTPDFEAAMARAIANGCRPLAKPVPAVAFGEKRIVFFMTPQFDIIELIEMPDKPTP